MSRGHISRKLFMNPRRDNPAGGCNNTNLPPQVGCSVVYVFFRKSQTATEEGRVADIIHIFLIINRVMVNFKFPSYD